MFCFCVLSSIFCVHIYSSFCLGVLTFLLLFAVVGPKLLELVKLFANIPTEEFLARLVESKVAGASTVMLSIGVESGPKIVLKSLVPHSGVVGIGAIETNVMKDRDKRRHRDGHSSKGHYSKKLKEP